MNKNSIVQLENTRKEIEKMNKFHQIEILKILKESDTITLNENNYGTFINMRDIPEEILDKIQYHIEYVNEQEINLKNIENQKDSLKNAYFENNKQEFNYS
tara:strand:- start:4163 stop:4465 length:303 start_codon:yes stop_codon:yes gene_type:complete